MGDAPVSVHLTTWISYHDTIQWETLTNPHFNRFDELVDIAKHIQLVFGYIDWLKFGEFTLIRQSFPLYGTKNV